MVSGVKTGLDWTPWAYAMIGLPVVLIAATTISSALAERERVRVESLRQTMQNARGQAQGTVKGLEVLIETHNAVDRSWAENRAHPWLTKYWSNIDLTGDNDLYAAVVDESGNIVLHTDSARTDKRLDREWYERRETSAGPDVVWASRCALCDDRSAYDVALPILVNQRQIGEFHQGVDAQRMEATIAVQQRRASYLWAGVLALVGVANAAAIGALLYLGRQQREAQDKLASVGQERARELAQIGAGLAHEVRNPLHALRINLHTLRRSFSGRTPLPQEQLLATIDESNSSINRLDELMRDLLQFADPARGEVEKVDLVHEVQSSLNLLAEGLRRDQIALRLAMTDQPTPISIDPVRLRQSLHNLLTYAQHRAGKNGQIDIAVKHNAGGAEMVIEDSGPPLPEHQRAHVFEPFQAPAETGSGLGLALVKIHVEEAGGRARFGCNGHAKGCQIWFPLATTASEGGTT